MITQNEIDDEVIEKVKSANAEGILFLRSLGIEIRTTNVSNSQPLPNWVKQALVDDNGLRTIVRHEINGFQI